MRPMFAESEPMCYSEERLWGSRTLELFKLTVTCIHWRFYVKFFIGKKFYRRAKRKND